MTPLLMRSSGFFEGDGLMQGFFDTEAELFEKLDGVGRVVIKSPAGMCTECACGDVSGGAGVVDDAFDEMATLKAIAIEQDELAAEGAISDRSEALSSVL
jgi:hypothetical protein